MNIHPLNKIKLVGTLVGIIAIGLVIGIKAPDYATATGSDNVHGFLWSDMPDGSDQSSGQNPSNVYGGRGLGWISMNSDGLQEDGSASNPSAASTIDYGVNIDAAGDIVGMAWGEYAGWLDFDPTGPTPPYNAATQAKIMPSCWQSTLPADNICKVIGWARFVAGTQAQAGGWDGWVSLNTVTTPTYGVEYNKTTGEFSGMAWGGNVAGWIDFSRVKMDTNQPTGVCTDSTALNYTAPPLDVNEIDDPSVCQYPVHVCTDPTASNYTAPPLTAGQVNDSAVCTYIGDLCQNITGNQQSLPSGYSQVGNNCYVDLCTNIPNVQQTLPVQYQGESYDDPNADKICTVAIPPILGCTNQCATNYDPDATAEYNPSTCIFPGTPLPGCGPGTAGPLNPIYKEN